MSKPQQPNRAVQTSGSKSLDEKRREAVELMHAKGAMKANRPAGNGYYVCAVGGECHASCRIHKGKDDLWMMTWKEEHKLLCAAISQAPAHMLESTMSIIRSCQSSDLKQHPNPRKKFKTSQAPCRRLETRMGSVE